MRARDGAGRTQEDRRLIRCTVSDYRGSSAFPDDRHGAAIQRLTIEYEGCERADVGEPDPASPADPDCRSRP